MNERPPPSAPAAAIATLLYVVGSLLIGALVAMIVSRAGWIPAGADPVRVARRCMMVAAGLLLWPYLLAIRVRWPDDLGFWPNHRRPSHWFLVGVAAGLLTLLPLALSALFTGTRPWHPAVDGVGLFRRVFTFGLSALVVGVVEETFSRGLLFMALRRAWGGVVAALTTGMIFAWAHYLKPAAEALQNPSLLGGATSLLTTGATHLVTEEYIVARFLNLLLMSLVLCATVHRTGSIWLAAGLHAGWVWLKKVNAVISDSDFTHPLRPLIGTRSDFLDGWGCTAMLVLLLVYFLRAPSPGSRGRRGIYE
jgi:membrane protease YdiL (CAAX protease family)